MDTPFSNKVTLKNKGQLSLVGKLVFIFFLILILMIPSSMIKDLIRERKSNQSNVAMEIGAQYGSDQLVTAPVLVIPRTITNEKKETYTSNLFVTATNNKIMSNVKTEVRHKSIYDVIVYQSKILINGKFDISNIPRLANTKYEFDQAYVITGLSDNSALLDKVQFEWDGNNLSAKPGTKHNDMFGKGIHSMTPIIEEQAVYDFEIVMNVKGSGSLMILPTARNNEVSIAGDWPDPGFVGGVSPKDYTITEGSFEGNWSIFDFGMSVPDTWVDGSINLRSFNNEAFGVKLVSVVDHYQKNFRAVKYALMIIILSFMAFFFFEIFSNRKIHPIQYLLIGAALVLFYALLLSFSEHFGFLYAYIISSVGIITMITTYNYYILDSGKSALLLAFGLAGLYTYIYVLLQLESYALIVGSVGLFIILFAIMFASRKVDWYQINKGPNVSSLEMQ